MNRRYDNGYTKMAVCPLTAGGGWQQELKMDLYYIHVDRKASKKTVSWVAGVCRENTQTAAVIGFRSGVSKRLSSMEIKASSETPAVWIHPLLQPQEFAQQHNRHRGCLSGRPLTLEVCFLPSESPLCLIVTF